MNEKYLDQPIAPKNQRVSFLLSLSEIERMAVYQNMKAMDLFFGYIPEQMATAVCGMSQKMQTEVIEDMIDEGIFETLTTAQQQACMAGMDPEVRRQLIESLEPHNALNYMNINERVEFVINVTPRSQERFFLQAASKGSSLTDLMEDASTGDEVLMMNTLSLPARKGLFFNCSYDERMEYLSGKELNQIARAALRNGFTIAEITDWMDEDMKCRFLEVLSPMAKLEILQKFTDEQAAKYLNNMGEQSRTIFLNGLLLGDVLDTRIKVDDITLLPDQEKKTEWLKLLSNGTRQTALQTMAATSRAEQLALLSNEEKSRVLDGMDVMFKIMCFAPDDPYLADMLRDMSPAQLKLVYSQMSEERKKAAQLASLLPEQRLKMVNGMTPEEQSKYLTQLSPMETLVLKRDIDPTEMYKWQWRDPNVVAKGYRPGQIPRRYESSVGVWKKTRKSWKPEDDMTKQELENEELVEELEELETDEIKEFNTKYDRIMRRVMASGKPTRAQYEWHRQQAQEELDEKTIELENVEPKEILTEEDLNLMSEDDKRKHILARESMKRLRKDIEGLENIIVYIKTKEALYQLKDGDGFDISTPIPTPRSMMVYKMPTASLMVNKRETPQLHEPRQGAHQHGDKSDIDNMP